VSGIQSCLTSKSITRADANTEAALKRADTANETASKQIRQDQRPWLYFKSPESNRFDGIKPDIKHPATDFHIEVGKHLFVEYKIPNIGKTPALSATASIVLEKRNIVDRPTFNQKDVPRPANTIQLGTIFPTDTPSPEHIYWLVASEQKGTVSPDDMRDWEQGNIYFSSYGVCCLLGHFWRQALDQILQCLLRGQ
jgi:hypothetical protein